MPDMRLIKIIQNEYRQEKVRQIKYDFFPHIPSICLTRQEWREIKHFFDGT